MNSLVTAICVVCAFFLAFLGCVFFSTGQSDKLPEKKQRAAHIVAFALSAAGILVAFVAGVVSR